jgi:hypothetical protein
MSYVGSHIEAAKSRRFDFYLRVEDPRLERLPAEASSCLFRSIRVLADSGLCRGPLNGPSFFELCAERYLEGLVQAREASEHPGGHSGEVGGFPWREFYNRMMKWVLARRRLEIPGLESGYFVLALSAISESACTVLRDEVRAGRFITEFVEDALTEFAVKRQKRKWQAAKTDIRIH